MFIRTERQSALSERVAALEAAASAVPAPNQPQKANGLDGNDLNVIVVDANGEPLVAPAAENAVATTAKAKGFVAANHHATTTKGFLPEGASVNGNGVNAPAKVEPELSPASGPSALPDHPSMGAILAAFARRQADAKRCLPPNTSGTHVALTFANTGKVAQIAVVSSTLDATAQACVRAALGTIQVEPFAKSQYEATLPLSSP